MDAFEQNDFFAETRRVVQEAEGKGTIINIHPLDMAELIDGPLCCERIDLIKATALYDDVDIQSQKQYIVIRDKVYFQTTDAPRTGNTIL